jgi:hypothetical protein
LKFKRKRNQEKDNSSQKNKAKKNLLEKENLNSNLKINFIKEFYDKNNINNDINIISNGKAKKSKNLISDLDNIMNIDNNKINLSKDLNNNEKEEGKETEKENNNNNHNNNNDNNDNNDNYDNDILSNSINRSEIDKNITPSISKTSSGSVNCFNDEMFENIIKEYLNINAFPTTPKEKINMLRKFITIYKRIKNDTIKLEYFLKKFSFKLKEEYLDVKVIINIKLNIII